MARKTDADARPGAVWRQELVLTINAAREAKRLSLVTMDRRLNKLAQLQARHCAGLGRLTHDGPDGSDVLQRVLASGYGALAAAELLSPAPTADLAVKGWLASKTGHRQYLFAPGWSHCGLGRVEYNGAVYWCVVLARPAMRGAED